MMNIFRPAGFVVVLVMLLGVNVRGQQALDNIPPELVAYPDWIVYNGKIVSMDDSTLNNSVGTTYQAMAIRGDRIQFLGSNDRILRYAGPQTRRLDLKGRTVVPGLIDTHNHLHNAAVSDWIRKNPDKIETIARTFNVTGNTFAELTQGIELVIKEQMAHPLPGQWGLIIVPGGGAGTGIGVEYLAQGHMDREKLDQLAPTLPVWVSSHTNEVMNTAARNDFLNYYAVEPTDANEEKILNPRVDRLLISERYFDRNLGELADVIENHLSHQVAGGFTTYSSHIMGLRFMPAFRMLDEEGRMPMRLAFSHRYCQQVQPDIAGCFLRMGDWAGMGSDYFWNVGLTLGGIDSGPPGFCTTMEGPERYKSMEKCNINPGNVYHQAIKTAMAARYRYTINHAYGDKALDQVLDIVDEVMKENPDITLDFIRSKRISSDHCGFYPRKEQLPRLKRFGWILSCGAQYLSRSEPWLEIYGQRYANRVVPVKSPLEAGIMVVGELSRLDYADGSGPTAAAYLEGLITRRNARGALIAPEEAVDRNTVMKMITTWASVFVLREKEIGSLEPGKLADFVVLNKDWFTVPDDEFPTVEPLMVVLGGKVASLREQYASEAGMDAVGPQLNFTHKFTYDFGRALEGSAGGIE
ncbi:MAG: amidohydrolase family protein [Acidobacteria bacterium]|nr:amidohydrolase family protein [Acidobacteriota bacterium]